MKVSSCCGVGIDDPIAEEFGICPECLEHCDFEEENPEENELRFEN
jgi:hypothetical protein